MSHTEQPTRGDVDRSSFAARDDAPWLEPFRRRRRRLRVLVGVATLLVVASAFLATVWIVHAGEALPGVSVAGVDVGGLGPEDIREKLADLVAARQADPVVFTHDDERFTYRPGEAYAVDLDAAVERALAEGRNDGPLRAAVAHVASLWEESRPIVLPADVTLDDVRDWVDSTADALDRVPFQGRVSASPDTLEVNVRLPTAGVSVRRGEMVRMTRLAITRDGPDRLEVPADTLPADVPEDRVREVAAQVERALEGPLTLRAHGVSVVLSPADIARLVASRVTTSEDGRGIELYTPLPLVRDVFEPHVERLNVSPRDATYELVSGLSTFDDKDDTTWTPRPAELRVVPGRNGVKFDARVTASQLRGILLEGRRSADLDLVTAPPKVTTEEASDYRVDQLIGTFTTYHSCCQPRVTNIQRMADIVRGTVVEPGDVFSVNGIVGRRTRSKGFVADGTIVNGEFVDEVGGGVSQFATTSYNAAFFAGLEIAEWKAHSYYISRYPMGREATLYYPTVDLKFKNTTDEAIYVHTSYTGESITVSLFGNNGGAEVRAEHGEPYNYRSGGTRYKYNPNLCAGCSRVVQSSGTGFDVVVHRIINGESERIFTRYKAQPRIIEQGPSE